MEVKDIRKLKIEDIDAKISESEKELVDLNMQKAAGEIKDVSLISKTRKTIARLNTILGEQKGVSNDNTK
jgi:large subunit ribosomal protein L29